MQLGGLGDYVISRWAIGQIKDPTLLDLEFILADHLAEIDIALGLGGRVQFLKNNDLEIPNLFDVRRKGVFQALLSGFKLRHLLQNIYLHEDICLVFHQLGIRQRFIGGNRRMLGLPVAPNNIYLAYLELFDSQKIEWSSATFARQPLFKRIGIFPNSRLSKKRFPAEVTERILRLCRMLDLQPQIVVLEDEYLEPILFQDITRIPRDFRVLMNTIRGLDAVISADSMPAHMSEFLGTPVFVITRHPNPYYLPLSAFHDGWCAHFSDDFSRLSTLARFLQSGLDLQP